MKYKYLYHSHPLLILTYSFAFILVYKSTLVSLLHRWTQYDEAYSHGFLVLFIICYLIYEKRHEISLSLSPVLLAASIPLVIFCFIWIVAYYVDIIIIQQLLLPVLILSVIALTAGLRSLKIFLFPISFLYFAIPIWDYLNSVLLSLTVSVTGSLIRAMGLTVLIEGDTITLPAGRILIAGGCSGLRYFIICLTLSTLASHLFIKNTKSKYLLIVSSLIISLIVNWVRVYSIIVIGYYSNMESKLVYDHELYGWLLFIIFYSPVIIASCRSSSDGQLIEDNIKGVVYNNDNNNYKTRYYVGWFLAFLFSIFLPYVLSTMTLSSSTYNFDNVSINILNSDWRESLIDSSELYIFSHSSIKPDKLIAHKYLKDGEELSIAIGLYQQKQDRKDFLPYNASIFDPDKWFITKTDNISINTSGGTISVNEINIQQYTTEKRRLIVYWYVVGGTTNSNVYLAKLSELYALLRGRKDAVFVYIQNNCDLDCNLLTNNMSIFIKKVNKSINELLYDVIGVN